MTDHTNDLSRDDANDHLTTADLAAGVHRAENKAERAGDHAEAAVERTADRTADRVDRTTDRAADRAADRAVDTPTMRADARADAGTVESHPPLFPSNETEQMRSRWATIQTNFVDEPRKSVEEADALVANAIKRLAEVFADERNKLEHQWSKGDQVSTEDLRQALRRYRAFFDRLLSV
jgi:hypothetical protein